LDADRRWALVFRDDAAALYVRRQGPMAGIADSFAYRIMPGGGARLEILGDVTARDTMLRRVLRDELVRSESSSPLNARAHSLLANLDFLDGNRLGARQNLHAALAVGPRTFGAHRGIGYLWLAESEWRRAIDEFEKELAAGSPPLDDYQRIAECWEKLGDPKRAATWYHRELALHPENES